MRSWTGPDLSTEHGRVLLNGGATSNDDAEVTALATARGTETIHATAVTDATGATITGSLQLLILTASEVSLTAELAA